MTVERRWRIGLRVLALAYLAMLLLIPVGLVFYRTFEHGLEAVWLSGTTPAAVHAFWLTIEVTLIAVPLNTVFGVLTALGLALVLVYGRTGWLGPTLQDAGIQVIFSVPGIVLATVFVSLPFVVREVTPVLREAGDESEQAAATLGASGWQTFWRVTLPTIRYGVAYGVVLSVARCIGEFGAVSVVSGKVAGQTQTLTILVEQRFQNFDIAGAYAASALLAAIALATLLALTRVKPRRSA